MRKTVHKWFWGWEFEKEEKWLNEMAAKGLSLVSVKFAAYKFEETLPGEYNICLQLLDNQAHRVENENYISFFEETGAEHVGTFGRWVYFRKKAAEGRFEIFSDNASRVKHLTNIIALLGWVTALNLAVGCYNLYLYLIWREAISLLFIVSFLVVILGVIGIVKLLLKRKKLKNEQQLFE